MRRLLYFNLAALAMMAALTLPAGSAVAGVVNAQTPGGYEALKPADTIKGTGVIGLGNVPGAENLKLAPAAGTVTPTPMNGPALGRVSVLHPVDSTYRNHEGVSYMPTLVLRPT